jgi:glycogen synthase
VHFHGSWAAESGVEGSSALSVRMRAEIERAVYRRADRLIVLSRAFGDELVQGYGVDARRVRVVPGGVDVARFAAAPEQGVARLVLGWPKDRPIVLCVRRLVRRMGLEHLIDAVVTLRREVPEVLVVIAGRGPLETELRERIADTGLQDHVRLLGSIPDDLLPAAYGAADLTVVPTVALEGFGLIAVESLAAGTPVLVTPVGGLPEVVAGLDRGLILDGTGVEPLARGLSEALRGARPLPAPETCRAYVESHFSWPLVARRVRDVYAEAISDAP